MHLMEYTDYAPAMHALKTGYYTIGTSGRPSV